MALIQNCGKCNKRISPATPIKVIEDILVGECCFGVTKPQPSASHNNVVKVVDMVTAALFLESKGFQHVNIDDPRINKLKDKIEHWSKDLNNLYFGGKILTAYSKSQRFDCKSSTGKEDVVYSLDKNNWRLYFYILNAGESIYFAYGDNWLFYNIKEYYFKYLED